MYDWLDIKKLLTNELCCDIIVLQQRRKELIKMKYKCPHCCVEIETADRLDFTIEDKTIEVEMLGYCPECERAYHWFEVYEFKRKHDFAHCY